MAIVKTLDILLRGKTGQLRNDLKRGESLFRGFVSTVGKLAAVAGIGSLFTFPVVAAARLEQVSTSFQVLTGNIETAKTLMGELQTFAASTPFEFPELANAAKKLLAFGTGANQVTSELRRIGDISAGIGAPIGEIAELYGKARIQGTLFAEDINQLTGRGIPVIQEFAKQLGVTQDKVKKLGSEGKINFSNLETAFMKLTSEGGKFFGMMEMQSQTTFGKFSTLKDNIAAALRPIGDEILPVLNDVIDGISNAIPSIANDLKSISALMVEIVQAGGLLSESMAQFGVVVKATVSDLNTTLGLVNKIKDSLGSGETAADQFAGNALKFVLTGGLNPVFLTIRAKKALFDYGEQAKETAEEIKKTSKEVNNLVTSAANITNKKLNLGSAQFGSAAAFETVYGVRIQAPMQQLIDATREGNDILGDIRDGQANFEPAERPDILGDLG